MTSPAGMAVSAVHHKHCDAAGRALAIGGCTGVSAPKRVAMIAAAPIRSARVQKPVDQIIVWARNVKKGSTVNGYARSAAKEPRLDAA